MLVWPQNRRIMSEGQSTLKDAVVNVKKLFHSSLMARYSKLECLSLASFNSSCTFVVVLLIE